MSTMKKRGESKKLIHRVEIQLLANTVGLLANSAMSLPHER